MFFGPSVSPIRVSTTKTNWCRKATIGANIPRAGATGVAVFSSKTQSLGYIRVGFVHCNALGEYLITFSFAESALT